MMGIMKHRLIGTVLAATLVLMQPAMLLADDSTKSYDARLEGYPSNVTLDGGSTIIMWLIVVGLAVIAVGVLFKNANRSPLD